MKKNYCGVKNPGKIKAAENGFSAMFPHSPEGRENHARKK